MDSNPTAFTSTSGIVHVSRKEFLDIQVTTECRFTLKRVFDMIRTYSHSTSQMLLIIENFCSIWKEVKMTNFNLFTSLILSQYFVKYTLNLGLFFHTWLCFKAFVASSLSWIVSDKAIRLSWHKTSFLICESPLSFLFNHLSHDCSRWKSQINTLQSVMKKTKARI